ncbi:MAG: hypothetical protein ACYC1A_12225, partial [Spirochaetales bacterium]
MAARSHGLKPLRIATLFYARRLVRKSAKAATRLMPKKATGSNIIFWIVIGFLFAPLAVLIIYSFNKSRSGEWTGFSFIWYQKLFLGSPDHWKAFQNSIQIA